MLASASPEALIGPIASATEQIRVGSGGVMLPHYSPLKVAETFTILAGAVSRSDRPRARTRRRHRSADDVRAPARPPRRRAGRLPPAARRAARLLRRHAPGRSPVQAPCRDAPGPAGDSGRVAARLLASECDLGCTARPPLRVRRLHQSGWGSEIASVYRERFESGRGATGAANRGRRLGAVRRHRRGGTAARLEQPDDVHAAPSRSADRRAAAGEGARVPRARGQADRRQSLPAAAGSSARRPRCVPGSTSLWPSTAPRS